MNNKNILFFIGGVVAGGIAGIFGTRHFLSDKYNKQFEECRAELEEYYQRTDEYARVPHGDDQNDRKSNVLFPEEGISRPGGRMSPEERASVKEKLQKNYKETTNYAAMYKTSNDVDPAEMEYPEEDSDEKNYDDQNEVSEEQAFEDHRKNMNKAPKIISVETYSNLPAHIDQQVLYFYSYDEALCDENEEIIEDPGLLVGDALNKYDFADSDERCIFVMNYATDTCYEIQKVDASWTDSH